MGFRLVFFYVHAMSSTVKKSIADFEDGNLVREHFLLSWTQEHFIWDGKVRDTKFYAVKPWTLKGEDAQKVGGAVQHCWSKISCASAISVAAESVPKLKAHFGSCFASVLLSKLSNI